MDWARSWVKAAENRLTAARELLARSLETERYFDWTANHAPTAIERVHAGEIAVEWALIADRDRQTVRELEADLLAAQKQLAARLEAA